MPSHQRLIADLEGRLRFHLDQAEHYKRALAAAHLDQKKPNKPAILSKTASVNRNASSTKIDFVFSLVEQHKAKGLTPSDVKQYAAAANIQAGANFPYFVLWQLKKEGSITARNGRYYPAPKNS